MPARSTDEPSSGREVSLLDLSWGGARFVTDRPAGERGDAIDVLLPTSGSRELELGAAIVRSESVGDAWHTAIRFVSVHPLVEDEFQRLLERLLKPRSEKTAPAVARRYEILYGDIDELRDALDTIAKGSLTLLLPEPMKVGESFRLALGCMRHAATLNVRARIAEQVPVRRGRREMFESRLSFEHPEDGLRERAGSVLGGLVR